MLCVLRCVGVVVLQLRQFPEWVVEHVRQVHVIFKVLVRSSVRL